MSNVVDHLLKNKQMFYENIENNESEGMKIII